MFGKGCIPAHITGRLPEAAWSQRGEKCLLWSAW